MAMKTEMEMEVKTVDRRDILSSGSTKSRNRKISLEEYLQFIDTQNHSDFSINYLNQIMAMHGYKKIHKTLKTTVMTAASSIAPVNPRRSTLKEKISPPEAEASLESIFMDLNELGWQECSLASVEAICAESKRSVPASPAPAPAPKRVRVRKPKEEAKDKQIALKPKPKPKKEAKLIAVKPKEASEPKPKRKRISAPKRVALKPVENGVVSEEGKGKGKQTKRATTKRVSKKKCGCTGCASQGPCQFIW